MRASRGIPFSIDVKGGERKVEHTDRGSNMMTGGGRERMSMSIATNDKGGDCCSKVEVVINVNH